MLVKTSDRGRLSTSTRQTRCYLAIPLFRTRLTSVHVRGILLCHSKYILVLRESSRSGGHVCIMQIRSGWRVLTVITCQTSNVGLSTTISFTFIRHLYTIHISEIETDNCSDLVIYEYVNLLAA